MCQCFGTLSVPKCRYIKFRCQGITHKKEYNIHNRVEHVLGKKVLIDDQLNSVVFVWRVTLCYTFFINVTSSLVFTFTVLNILLSCNWVNLVFSVLFRTMEVGDLPDTFAYHAGMLHIVIMVDSSWNVMAHGDAWEGKWRGNWPMEWVASTFHTTLEHGVSSITTTNAHNSAASSWLNWCLRWFKWTRLFQWETKSGFCACAITFQLASETLILGFCSDCLKLRKVWNLEN